MTTATPDLRELRADLKHLRVGAQLVERLSNLVGRANQPLECLHNNGGAAWVNLPGIVCAKNRSTSSVGANGHVYWDGWPKGFIRNDKKIRVPRRWWYAHKHGTELGPYEDFVPTCGEVNCINPEHCQVGRDLRRRQFSDEQMLNAVKVAGLRLGRAPSMREWEGLGMRPSLTIFKIRFGSWETVIRKAGLKYVRSRRSGRPATASECLKAVRHVRRMLGRWPSRGDFENSKDMLHEADLPSSLTTVCRHLGSSWPVVLRKAGKR